MPNILKGQPAAPIEAFARFQVGFLFCEDFHLRSKFLFGWLLTASLNNYPLLLQVYAGSSFMMAGCVLAIEKVKLSRSNKVKLFDAFRHTGENHRFRRLLVSWMILGIGNLLSFSLFVEYITNKQYGFDLSENHVSIITTVIPETCFFVFVLVWGRLFDRLNFYLLRCILNAFFAAGIGYYLYHKSPFFYYLDKIILFWV